MVNTQMIAHHTIHDMFLIFRDIFIEMLLCRNVKLFPKKKVILC